MDPTLQEQLEGNPEDEIEVIVRLHDGERLPVNFRAVSRFGNILTGRVLRGRIQDLWSSSEVASVKASRLFLHDAIDEGNEEESIFPDETERRRPPQPNLPFTGKGIYIGSVDWGIDFTHPNFIDADGRSRIHSLWDQTGAYDPQNNPYGYGRIYVKQEIDRALQTESPFAALGYHPGKADPFGVGSHGTHVLDIAAGRGSVGTRGLAPDAMILAVHLGAEEGHPKHSIGNSVRLLEGLHFLDTWAGETPLMINLSMGKHGGPHTGQTLTEQALDFICASPRTRIITQSAGNYYLSDTHTSGRLLPGQRRVIRWEFPHRIVGHHEMEIWYSGKDSIAVSLLDPSGRETDKVMPGSKTDIVSPVDGSLAGRLYNRAKDPNTGFNHIHIFLYQPSPGESWQALLEGREISDGWYHGWIERVVACKSCQSVFDAQAVDRNFTTGTISNGRNTISVGAYDAHDPNSTVGFFSSAGPTLDLRSKPQCLAPGVKILAAKSSSPDDKRSTGAVTFKTGTSMASPMVAGVCALLAEGLGSRCNAADIKMLLRNMLRFFPRQELSIERYRVGDGLLGLDALQDVLTTLVPVTNQIIMNSLQLSSPPPSTEEAPEDVSEEAPEDALEEIPAEMLEELALPYSPVENATSDTDTPSDAGRPNKNVLMRKLEALEATIEDKVDQFSEKIRNWLHAEHLDGSFFKRLKQAFSGDGEDLTVIGYPGQPLRNPIREGDILLRHAHGEGLPLHVSIIADRDIQFAGRSGNQRYRCESNLPGGYVNVIEGGPFPITRSHGFARKLLNEHGYLPGDQLLLRIRSWAPDEEESLLTSDPANKDFIRWAQSALNTVQNAGLTVDGVAGPLTKASIRTFQIAKGLQVDGMVGPQTQAALEAAGATPYKPGGGGQPGKVTDIPQAIKFLLDQAVKGLAGIVGDLGTQQATGGFDYKLGGKTLNIFFSRFEKAIFFYRPDLNQVVEVHGPIYDEYKKSGFDANGIPGSALRLPIGNNSVWNTNRNSLVGSFNLFDNGKIYYRSRDNKIITQCMIQKDSLYWGVDSVESYARTVGAGKLVDKTGFVPCFIGQYLPRGTTSGFSTFAASIHQAFQASLGLCRILLIDNRGTTDTGTRYGRDNGHSDAASACLRGKMAIDAYRQLPGVKDLTTLSIPDSLAIYRDIEPEFRVDQDYIEGFIDGFKEYNNGSPQVKFQPGIYMSFHPTYRPFNIQNIDNLTDKNIRLWAQHPNYTTLTEKNMIDHGYKPYSPTTVACDVWQFNNGDVRFKAGNNFWIDHDMATAAGFNGFWEGDQELYMP